MVLLALEKYSGSASAALNSNYITYSYEGIFFL